MKICVVIVWNNQVSSLTHEQVLEVIKVESYDTGFSGYNYWVTFTFEDLAEAVIQFGNIQEYFSTVAETITMTRNCAEERKEVEATKVSNLKKNALAKLTHEEQKVLGLCK